MSCGFWFQPTEAKVSYLNPNDMVDKEKEDMEK